MSQSQSHMSAENGIFSVQKMRGETLATLLARFRSENNLSLTTKLTYAGRLDPMAEGLVLILAGESRFQKDKLLGLTKIYEMEIMLGISTDTEDVLGLITDVNFEKVEENKIRQIINEITSITSLAYPMYSSVPVAGKALFMHAREGNVVEIPEKKVSISNVEILEIRNAAINDLNIISDIKKVEGDFRQAEIINKWQEHLDKNNEVILIKIRASVSSGTYMRSLARWVGEQLGVPALAYTIRRTSIGEYSL